MRIDLTFNISMIFLINAIMELSNDFKSCLRHFVYYYTNGTLPYVIEDEVLKGIDYREDLKHEASLVETVFAIYTNNIQMDERGKVINNMYAMKRAAQWIRYACRQVGDGYAVDPELEDWETYLY